MRRSSRRRSVIRSVPPFTRPPVRRFHRILEALQRDTTPTRRDLAEEFEVTVKTIQRDIDFLRDQLRFPIEFDAGRGGYVLKGSLSGARPIELTPGELVSILVLERALEAYQGSAVEAPLRAAFDKLALAMDGKVSISLAEMGMGVSVRQPEAASVEVKIFQTLAAAVRDEEAVEIEHTKLGEKKAKRRKVEPYHLASVQGAWYLIGHDLRSGEVRTFHVSRIRRAVPLGMRFTRPKDFSVDRYWAGAFGVFRGRDDYAVVLRFDAWAAQLVREKRFHGSQRLQELTDGGVEMRMTLSSLEEVEPWVLSWGGHVRVMGPKELLRRVRASGAALVANHGGG